MSTKKLGKVVKRKFQVSYALEEDLIRWIKKLGIKEDRSASYILNHFLRGLKETRE